MTVTMMAARVYGRFFASRLPGCLLLLLVLGSAFVVGAVEGQNITASSSEIGQTATSTSNFSTTPASIEPVSSSSSPDSFSSSEAPATGLDESSSTSSSSSSPVSSSSADSSGTAGPNSTTVAPTGQPEVTASPAAVDTSGQSLYDQCGVNGTVCYGDKGGCIKTGSCTFLGAIQENDSFINVTLLTRVYNPPYDGVNLTVELSRDKKGNDSVLRCGRIRFKTFKILLSWKNKTTYEVNNQPGNETQTAQTLIDKNQLKADCLADLEKNNFTIPPSQSLALKFYIANNNNKTLVQQGLTHITLQDTTTVKPPSNNSREGKALDLGDGDAPAVTESPVVAKEKALYQMCLKNTAKCFGDRSGCTEGHNCTILGVIKETRDNYHVYLVTKSYDPPLDYINLTLTLNAPLDNSTMATNSAGSLLNITSLLNMTDLQVDCGRQEFTDLSLQSVWKTNPNASNTITLSLTNASQILETTVDKQKLQSRCEMNVKNLKGNLTGGNSSSSNNNNNNGTDDSLSAGILEDDVHVYVKFHLENGTLSPSDSSDDLLGSGLGDSISITNENGTFAVGQNGTAYLVLENTGAVVMEAEDDTNSNNNANDNSNSGRTFSQNSGEMMYFSYLLLLVSASLVLYSNSRPIC